MSARSADAEYPVWGEAPVSDCDPLRTYGRGVASGFMKANAARLPRRRWPIWSLMAGVILGLPLTAFVYFPVLLSTGTLSPDEDSVGIPMFGSILLALLMLPVAIALTYFSIRGSAPSASLTAWRHDRPLLSVAVSVLFLGPATLVLLLPLAMTLTSATPLIELLWLPYALCCAGWCLALRSAALSPTA